MKNKMKKSGRLLIALMLITSVFSVFISPVQAVPDPATRMGMDISENTEIGGQFNATVWLYCNDSIDSWYINLINWTAGAMNATPDPGWGGYKGNGTIIPSDWSLSIGGVPSYTNGSVHNDTGNITVIQGYTSGAAYSLVNKTACSISFVGLDVGTHDIVIMGPGAFDGGPDELSSWYNASVTIYAQNPTLTATVWNHTAINLTFTPGEGGDNVTVCGKAGSYPNSPSDNMIYNGSNGSYNWSSLNPCTTYYFSAWSWNETEGTHSLTNATDTGMTSCYTNFTFAGENPTNSSTTANCTYDITVNVTIKNSLGPPFQYWINCSDGSSTSGTSVVNQSISVAMNGLNHNTSYSWDVTTSKDGDTHVETYYFTTGQGGGTAPTATADSPTNGAVSQPVTPTNFSATVADVDGDPVNVTFLWNDGTQIGTTNMTYPGNQTTVSHIGPLNYGTTYRWYMLVNDTSGCGQSTRYPSSGFYSFQTDVVSVNLTKEWEVLANNTIHVWINATNLGEANLTNVIVNDSYDTNTAFAYSVPANDSGDIGSWTIPFLNMTGYANDSFYISVYLTLANQIANGTSIQNTVNATFNGIEYNETNFANPPTMCLYATKEGNETSLKYNMTKFNFTINITNCGDFYLNWVQVNETYDTNFTYNSSNITPDTGNLTFNITQIAPGSTAQLWILVDINGTLENQTYHYNNITIDSNETSPVIFKNVSWITGARTEAVRIHYVAALTNVGTIGDNVIAILGILLIIGAIMLIVYVVRKSYGGGE